MSAASPTQPKLRDMLTAILRAMKDRPLSERGEPFTLEEIADRWGCSPKHVERLCISRELKGFKPGRSWRVRPTALAKYERDLSGEGE